MSNVTTIDKLLKKLAKVNDETKGDLGEQIVFEVVKRYQQNREGAIVIHTAAYPYCSGVPGNIKLVDKELKQFSEPDAKDEIDIVLVTQNRIFLMEVKAYRHKVLLTNDWTYRPKGPIEKSIPMQAEKHARHFYYSFYDVLPDGVPEYIVPLIVIADKGTIVDKRTSDWKRYLPIVNLNCLNKTISDLDKPLKYALDIENILAAIKLRASNIGEISI